LAPFIRSLSMSDYRGIHDCTTTFSPSVTVLFGTNGAGKTAILDCLRLLFDSMFMSLSGPAELMTAPRQERTALSRNARSTDVSLGRHQMRCEVSFGVRWRNKKKPRNYTWPLQVAVSKRTVSPERSSSRKTRDSWPSSSRLPTSRGRRSL